jgi:hypothetical protein
MLVPRFGKYLSILLIAVISLAGSALYAGVTASVSGTVKDSTGAAVPGASVTATNTATGISQTQTTNGLGYYSFQYLPIGTYDLGVQHSGFKAYRKTGIVLNVDDAVVVDVALQVGEAKDSVVVASNAVHVETASSQLGEVIEGERMTTVPLVSRSFTDLLALQPGVVSTPSGISGGYAGQFSAFTSAGFAEPAVSGSLNGGALSVNGQREANNGFILNGINVKDSAFGGATVIPNLDSLAEFRILTNNYDAEYGNYSGGQINVVTKSGTNSIHGNAFEFLRNTSLDAAGFFDAGKRGVYHQNEFGGTAGGPIKKDKIFFFADYQGNRIVQGASTGISVPSPTQLTGDFSGLASADAFSTKVILPVVSPTNPVPVPKTVNGATWAQSLATATGNNAIVNGFPYYFLATDYNPATNAQYGVNCTNANQCVFPNGTIPAKAISKISQNFINGKYFPTPTTLNPNGTAFFSSSAFPFSLTDNKASGRVDANTRFGSLFSYYAFDRYSLDNPYPTANVPGFDAAGIGQTQALALGDTKTFGSSSVNEFRLGFVRVNNIFNQPKGGKGVTLASLGFSPGGSLGTGTGINALDPAIEGVPEVDFLGSGTVIGVPSRPIRLVENTYQVVDNFSKVSGTHTLKFGGSFHYNQLVEQISNVLNGNFQFDGSETGIDFADFLIGAPVVYVQGQALPFNGRAKYLGLYGQDSWRARSNLTLNYGLRWDVSTPWYEQHNQIETIVPGLQSIVFPGSPQGWVFPGDPGIPRGLAPTRYNNLGPRVGLAYSPSGNDGFLRKLTGGPGQTSIRAGYGLFFTANEGATDYNEIGDSPFGFFYTGSAPRFSDPFQNRTDGVVQGQKYPVVFPPLNVGPKNPDNNVNWANFTPIGSSPGFYYKNRLPYTENYDLSIQRQFGTATLLTVSYVGAQGHRLLTTMEANPGIPAACLALATAGCGPGTQNNFDGVRTPFPNHNLFQSDGWFITNGQSSYNSLQVNLRHTTGRLQLLAGYTFSKALDNASGYGEQVNFMNPKKSIALSAFDATHNFVVSYSYNLPFDKLASNRLTKGWALSGITRFSTGLPVIIYENDNNSLLGTTFAGPITLGLDVPNYTGGPVHILNPRASGNQQYFVTTGFSQETVGQLGNSSRRFFHGPGINNWDVALLKDTKLTERLNLQFRAEFFNVFNHTQFGFVQGNILASNFGSATSAAPPRIGQLSLKLNF